MTFQKIVAQIEKVLDDWIADRKKQGLDTDSWLQALYASYSERMRSDNERIWTTGSLLLPLSVSAFAVVVSLDDPTLWKVVVLAIGSLVLIWAWLFIAENHRAFQQKSEAWLVAIQRRIGIDDKTPNKAAGNALNDALTFPGAIQKMRWAIAVLISVTWFILALWIGLNHRALVQQDGPANGSQPIRAETNSTSSAAGSRR